jgi:hypothetical protein
VQLRAFVEDKRHSRNATNAACSIAIGRDAATTEETRDFIAFGYCGGCSRMWQPPDRIEFSLEASKLERNLRGKVSLF